MEEDLADANLGSAIIKKLELILRGDVVTNGKRIDGRDTKTVRPIVSEGPCPAPTARRCSRVARRRVLS